MGKRPTSQKDEECPECNSINFVHDRESGEIACTDCGLVLIDQERDRGPEWRIYEPEQMERRRTGAPLTPLIHNKGLSTFIGRHSRDAYGRQLPMSTRWQMLRLRKWQMRFQVDSWKEKNLSVALPEIIRLGNKLHLPIKVVETAAIIYRKALDEGLRGRDIQLIAPACIYAACRSHNIARGPKDIEKVSIATEKEINHNYRFLFWKLKLKIPQHESAPHIEKIAGNLKISQQTQQLAFEILEVVREIKLTSGRDPSGLAAAALYIACILAGEKRTQEELGEQANVSEVTIRNIFKPWLKRLIFHFSLGVPTQETNPLSPQDIERSEQTENLTVE